MKSALCGLVVVAVAALVLCAEGGLNVRGMQTGMPAPRIVYSCTVENALEEPIDVEVRFSHPFENRIVTDRATLAAGEQKLFDRRDYHGPDGATYAAVVSGVTVRSAADHTLEQTVTDFHVHSPVANYRLRVAAADVLPAGFEIQHGVAPAAPAHKTEM